MKNLLLAMLLAFSVFSCQKEVENKGPQKEYNIYHFGFTTSYMRIYINGVEIPDVYTGYIIKPYQGDKVKIRIVTFDGNTQWLKIRITEKDPFVGEKFVYESQQTKSSFTYEFTTP